MRFYVRIKGRGWRTGNDVTTETSQAKKVLIAINKGQGLPSLTFLLWNQSITNGGPARLRPPTISCCSPSPGRQITCVGQGTPCPSSRAAFCKRSPSAGDAIGYICGSFILNLRWCSATQWRREPPDTVRLLREQLF